MLQKIVLQNFRNYSQKKFDFSEGLNVIIGPNTVGKTNLVEAVALLSTGKSLRAEKDFEMIRFGQDVGRVQALTQEANKLEVMLAQGASTDGRFIKKYLVNEVSRSRQNFVGHLPSVLFRPESLEIVIDGPSLRRRFLDEVLEQTDTEYRRSKTTYDRAIRQRNALLHVAREFPQGGTIARERLREQFAYWDNLLIVHGKIITQKREEFLAFVNTSEKTIFDIEVAYDKSIISEARLLEYKDAEIAAGVTLVGPQRDDFQIFGTLRDQGERKNIQHYASRGQQRLVILQLMIHEMLYMEDKLGSKPLLILDDIFSELDASHIEHVLRHAGGSQIILTTTHGEYVEGLKDGANMIELER